MKLNMDLVEREIVHTDLLIKDINLSAKEITQFFRGYLYTIIDFILEDSSDEKLQCTEKIVTLFRKLIILIAKYYKSLANLIPSMAEGYKYKNLFLIDTKVALALSWYEVTEVIKMFFLQLPRVAESYAVLFLIRKWKSKVLETTGIT